jgi:hypothetical protein
MRSLTLSALLLVALLPLPAAAGPLADGYRGTPWGAPFDAAQPPTEGCTAVTTSPAGASWLCRQKLADAHVTAIYLYGAIGKLHGVVVNTRTPATECMILLHAAQRSYGPGVARYPGTRLLDRAWADGEGRAEYADAPGACQLLLHHRALTKANLDAEQAALPADSL